MKPSEKDSKVKLAKPAKMSLLPKPGKSAKIPPPEWDLRLYVADGTQKSIVAFRNLQQLCDKYLAGRYRIEVIDLVKQPQLAKGDQILAVPTVVRRLPSPIRKIIGTLSDFEQVIVGLDLRTRDVPSSPVKKGL